MTTDSSTSSPRTVGTAGQPVDAGRLHSATSDEGARARRFNAEVLRAAGRCAPVRGRRFYVSVRESVHERLLAIASARSVPLTLVLAEMLKGWEPMPEDASRARLDEDGNAAVWIDAGLHGRLRIAARERGVAIKALAEEALRGVL